MKIILDRENHDYLVTRLYESRNKLKEVFHLYDTIGIRPPCGPLDTVLTKGWAAETNFQVVEDDVFVYVYFKYGNVILEESKLYIDSKSFCDVYYGNRLKSLSECIGAWNVCFCGTLSKEETCSSCVRYACYHPHDDQCAICLSNERRAWMRTECGHYFHLGCWNTLTHRGDIRFIPCPICRHEEFYEGRRVVPRKVSCRIVFENE